MADNIKISALTELVSGSIVGASVVPIVEAGVTYKAQLSSIKAFTNSDVATDTELANGISSVNNTISGLDTDDISEGTAQYYTDTKVKTKLDAEGVLSGSLPAGYNLDVIAGGTSVSSVDSITVYGADATDNGSGDITLSINSSSLTVSDERLESIADVTQIKLVGANVDDSGSGIIQITVDGVDVSSLNTFTGSINSSVNTLEADVILLNTFTGSFSASMEGRVTTLESVDAGEATPEGTISSSQQITDFGFVSSSSNTFEILSTGVSVETDVQSINFVGAELAVTSTNGDVTVELSGGSGGGGIPYDGNFHSISQSIADPTTTNLALSQIKIGTGINDFTFSSFSESLDSRFGAGGGSDYISNVVFVPGQLTFTGQGNAFNGVVGLSDGIVSSSTQITEFGFANTSDINEAYIKNKLPENSISSSIQIINDGFVTTDSTASFASKDAITGSFTELSASIAADIISNAGGVSVVALGEATRSLLEGGSFDVDGNVVNLVSSSTQIQEGISDAYISASAAASGFSTGTESSHIPYLLIVSESVNAFTQSIDSRVTSIEDEAFLLSLNTFTGSFSSSVEGRETLLESDVQDLNTFIVLVSSSMEVRVTTLESAGSGSGTQLEIKDEYSVISQSYDFGETNLKLEAIEIGGDSGNYTFKQVSQSLDDRINAVNGVSELSGLSDVGTITVDVAEGDILVYDSVAQEFTHSQDLTGNYKITGSIDTKGPINVSGSVTADSFIAGDVGTPTISAATTLEIDAGNTIQITTGGGGLILSSSADVRVNHMLTLEKTIGNPSASPLTGSMMNSGSVTEDSKLWFFNGTEWKEISFVS